MFEIKDFNQETLFEFFRGPMEVVSPGGVPGGPVPRALRHEKRQFSYLFDYLRRLEISKIVVERDYVDRDFLADYSSYYVRCFGSYERRCTRIHFLSGGFTALEFQRCLEELPMEDAREWLQARYKGFIVLKPLPSTTIGRTCLPTLAIEDAEFTVRAEQPVNLFGFELFVRNTLPFQEQDQVVAACATSVLWSAFQFTGKRFQHATPTPVEITHLATTNIPSDTRHLPTRGLTLENVAQAIRAVGLEPYAVPAANSTTFLATLYAYLRGKVPVFINMHIYDLFKGEKSGETKWQPRGDDPNGLHGVLAVGYRLERRIPREEYDGQRGLLLRANCMAEIYVHDDRVGPFCSLELDWTGSSVVQQFGESLSPRLITQWPRLKEELSTRDISEIWRPCPDEPVRAGAHSLMVPLYPTIRISFDTIKDIIYDFDSLLVVGGERFVWDIHLTLGCDAKASVVSEGRLTGRERSEFLTKSLPRFVWRANACLVDGTPVLDFFFDATDIRQGRLLLHALVYPGEVVSSIYRKATASYTAKKASQPAPQSPPSEKDAELGRRVVDSPRAEEKPPRIKHHQTVHLLDEFFHAHQRLTW